MERGGGGHRTCGCVLGLGGYGELANTLASWRWWGGGVGGGDGVGRGGDSFSQA